MIMTKKKEKKEVRKSLKVNLEARYSEKVGSE